MQIFNIQSKNLLFRSYYDNKTKKHGYQSVHNGFTIKKSYSERYKSFINSPHVHFVYETFFYILFLLLFSIIMLSKFNYYEDVNESPASFNSSEDSFNSSDLLVSFMKKPMHKRLAKPSQLEYVLIAWVLSYLIDEIFQVQTNISFDS